VAQDAIEKITGSTLSHSGQSLSQSIGMNEQDTRNPGGPQSDKQEEQESSGKQS
jgi:hypothetical protein